jgi:hypothetical protein
MIAARVWRGLLHMVDAHIRTHARTPARARTHPPVAFGTLASEPSVELCGSLHTQASVLGPRYLRSVLGAHVIAIFVLESLIISFWYP